MRNYVYTFVYAMRCEYIEALLFGAGIFVDRELFQKNCLVNKRHS